MPSATRHNTKERTHSRRRDLSKGKLVEASITLLDQHGIAAFSLRPLASAMEITPMALYNHFNSKQELLCAVAGRLVTAVDFLGNSSGWRATLLHCFERLRGLCLNHPYLPDLLKAEGAVPEAAFAPMKITLKALAAEGMNETDGLRTFFLLTSYTLGQAAYQTAPVPGLDPFRRRMDNQGYQGDEVGSLSSKPAAWDFDASFDYGLGLILDGIAVQLQHNTVG